MKRANVNFWVDTAALVVMVGLSVTGAMIHWRLPPGGGHGAGTGEGLRAHGKAAATVWSMTRHEWGDVHFYLAMGLLTLMAVHLFLHWRWIYHLVRGQPAAKGARFRVVVGLIALLGVLALASLPLWSPIEQQGRGTSVEEKDEHEDAEEGDSAVRGNMTLAEVAAASGVPVGDLIQQLGLPSDTPPDSRLGPLRRRHGFAMEDVRRIIKERKAKQPTP